MKGMTLKNSFAPKWDGFLIGEAESPPAFLVKTSMFCVCILIPLFCLLSIKLLSVVGLHQYLLQLQHGLLGIGGFTTELDDCRQVYQKYS